MWMDWEFCIIDTGRKLTLDYHHYTTVSFFLIVVAQSWSSVGLWHLKRWRVSLKMVNCDAVLLWVSETTQFAYPIEARQTTINILTYIREVRVRARLSYIWPNSSHNYTRRRTPSPKHFGLVLHGTPFLWMIESPAIRTLPGPSYGIRATVALYVWCISINERLNRQVSQHCHSQRHKIGVLKSRM